MKTLNNALRAIRTWRPTAREILALRATQSGLRYRFRQEEADGLWTVTDPWTGNLAGVWAISGGGGGGGLPI